MTSETFETAKVAKVNGTTLAYREEGEGEPVVFVHGALSDLRTWGRQLPVVGRSCRAITYSRRFARPNEDIDPGADDPWLRHVEDLSAFLREIGAVPAHLVGHSQGAFISMLTAVRHPDVVRTLVLEEPPVVPLFVKSTPPRPAELLRLFATRPRIAVGMIRFGAKAMVPMHKAFQRGEDDKAMGFFVDFVLGKEALERLPEDRMVQMRDNVSTQRAFALGAGFPPLGDDDVRSIHVPVLLVTGALSPTLAHLWTDRLEELLPILERINIPEASHLMHEENASAVNEAIVGFLGRHRDDPVHRPRVPNSLG